MNEPLASSSSSPDPLSNRELGAPASPQESLLQIAARYEMPITEKVARRLEDYCQALWAWNQKINLTRHTDFQTFVARDLADVMALSRHLSANEHVLDVGSGGGVPGIPLQIVRPDLSIELSDTIAKKTKVLEDIVRQLKLKIPVHTKRGEHVLQQERFNTVVARAVGPLAKILRWFKGSWDHMDRLLLIKGPRWVEERGEARHYGLMNQLELRRLEEYANPSTGVKSVILQISPPRPAP